MLIEFFIRVYRTILRLIIEIYSLAFTENLPYHFCSFHFNAHLIYSLFQPIKFLSYGCGFDMQLKILLGFYQ